jgi:hypothetical protein
MLGQGEDGSRWTPAAEEGTILAKDSALDSSARGRERREKVPRSAHATWEPASTRDPIGVLETQATTRVAALVPIR